MTLRIRTEAGNSRQRRLAFTLMEMLVVVAIIVVLAGVGGAYLLGRLEDSKLSAAQGQARVIGSAVQQFYLDNSVWPNTLQDLLMKNADGKGPYLERADALLDPWGRQFQYDQTGQNNTRVGAVVLIPDIFCVPPNSNMPVGNWKEPKR